jgi:hypothetical protein
MPLLPSWRGKRECAENANARKTRMREKRECSRAELRRIARLIGAGLVRGRNRKSPLPGR